MNFRKPLNYVILAVTIAAIAGILVGTFGPTPASTYSLAQVQEDDPRWNCEEMGNKVCGDPEGTRATAAWEAWDSMSGWTRLKVDPTKETRVDYVGYAVSSPRVEVNETALPSKDGLWYVFRATITD